MKKIFVTKILNEYEVVLNVGYDDGINKNTTFHVLGETDIIKDPITSEPLGGVPFIKENLQIKQLFPKLCICESEGNGKYIRENSIFKNLRIYDQLNTGRLVHEKLNIDIDDLSKEVDSAICLHDSVEISSMGDEPQNRDD